MVKAGAGRRGDGHARSRSLAARRPMPGVSQAQRALDEARANLDQQQTQVKLAKQELDRTSALVPKGYATAELLDQRRQQMDAARRRAKRGDGQGRRGRARARRRAPRGRALRGQHRRQRAGRAARRPHRVPGRQCRRGPGRRRQGLHDARHRLRLHGHLPADRGGRPGQARLRGPHRARCLSRRMRSRPRWCSSPARRNSPPRPSKPRTSATS